ncbi:MAG: MCE family protein [Candidatus Omnitrophica bacterium]|nr:MCE family protein [Candidatus Omnitrophota bacterium]
MTSNTYTASEVRSGFFVTFSSLLLLGLIFMCGSSTWFSKTYPVHVRFNFISGLAKNAPVQLAGHEVGKVTNIHFIKGPEMKVDITLAILKGVEMRENAQVFIEVMGFMGEKYVEIKPGSGASPVLKEGGILEGVDPVPLMEVVHRGVQLLDDFDKITASLQTLITGLDQIVVKNKKDVDAIFVNLNAASGDLKEMTHDLKLHPWKILRKGKEKEENAETKKKKFLIL